MKFNLISKTPYGTDHYKVIADEGEALTNEAIENAIPFDIAPFGCAVVYCNGKEAEVKAYVD